MSRNHSSVEAHAPWQFYDFSEKYCKLMELDKYCLGRSLKSLKAVWQFFARHSRVTSFLMLLFFSLSHPLPFLPTPNRGGRYQNLEWNKCEPEAVAFQPFFKCDFFANGFADNKYEQSSKCDVLSK